MYLSDTLVLAGFSQPGGMRVSVEVGTAPHSADRIRSVVEARHPTPQVASEAPKEHTPMHPEPQAPHSPLDLSTGNLSVQNVMKDSSSCSFKLVYLNRSFLIYCTYM